MKTRFIYLFLNEIIIVMVSPRFYLILALLMFVIPANGIEYAGSLTINECKACELEKQMLIRFIHFSIYLRYGIG
jgi:hypothetical protein